VQDPAFVQWLTEIEGAVTIGDSSATLINDMIAFGPSRYDAVVTYENLALQLAPNARSRWNDDLVLIYPPATLLSNHPYAILNADWVTGAQRAAAQQFRDFLLSRAQQEQALAFGFRPALRDVALDGATSLLRADGGAQQHLPPATETPSAETIRALLDMWMENTQR
jgi:ABC-type sulfate transport system substrate-binding protein